MEINLIKTKNLNILKQLQLEEYIFKKREDSWCIINEGTEKTIVLGVSNDINSHVNMELIKKNKIPIIKRFTGGGSVIVDKNTIFVTFIISKKNLNFSYPEEIFKWSENFYKKIFKSKYFKLIENDYVFKKNKFAGSAQYIKKDKWLHHTSFLWDFEKKNMDLLLIPKKTPKYRKDRDHNNFLCNLQNFFQNKEEFIDKIITNLKKMTVAPDFDTLRV
ncbi:MAG: hypothetical protein AMS24_02990 [Chlamydiae bacterium SM23_39]|nr:MAG: hypothetical protein AMS24_02990 [Chlamydiae bacterium SM23_39]